jgi:hypothetical protein
MNQHLATISKNRPDSTWLKEKRISHLEEHPESLWIIEIAPK